MAADKIANLCYNLFNSLPKSGKPSIGEWTILSCIIKENTLTNYLEVVALGTGTKCIGQNQMSNNGDILNDSHAEIICRRAFLRYLYHQMNEGCIFEFNGLTLKYSLKTNIKFHFFTSHVPCGDAAIFPKQDSSEFGECLNTNNLKRKRSESSNEDSDNSVTNTKSDIFRTGAKCLPQDSKRDSFVPGSNYHVLGAIRTKPGRGNRTLSVSCSDKLTKWVYVGIQGALLMILMDKPIYLSSMIIAGGVPFDYSALTRALYKRFNCGKLNVNNVELHKLDLYQASKSFAFEKDNKRKPCPSSIIWCKVEDKFLECAVDGKKQGVTKKNYHLKTSRLKICKMELFREFLNVYNKHHKQQSASDFNKMTYLEVKNSASDYQKAWSILKDEIFKLWTVKDSGFLKFYVD